MAESETRPSIEPTNPSEQKGIKNLISVTEAQVMRQWAIGEARNPKWGRRNEHITDSTRERLLTTSSTEVEQQLTEEDNQQIMSAFYQDKDRLAVQEIVKMQCEWKKGTLSLTELEDLYMVQWPLATNMAPSGKIGEFITALQAGKFPPEEKEFVKNVQRLKNNFDPQHMVGAPVILGESNNPPYCAVDGISRICAMILLAREGKMPEEAIPVYLGTSPKVFAWEAIPPQMQQAA